MSSVRGAWRAASRRQKVAIVAGLLFALAGVSTLATPPPSLSPGQAGAARAIAITTPAAAATAIAGLVSPTEPLVPSPASSNLTANTTPAPTPIPTPTTSPIPTPKPSPIPVVLTVRIIGVTSPAYRNSFATLAARTNAGSSCSIEVDYASGPSSAAGLGSTTANSSGSVSWTWKVGGRTTKGTWPIFVTCSWNGQAAAASTTFRVA